MHWTTPKMLGPILFITISLCLGVNGLLIACPGKGCEDKCLADCHHAVCNVTYFAQLSPCSYACTVNDQYRYHTEPNFQSCGTDKVCYQGQCVLTDSTYECQNIYGKDYISVENPWNPCNYLCVPLSGCGRVYSEDIHNGCKCVVGNTHILGRCRSGICIGNYRHFDPYYSIGMNYLFYLCS
ncbi:uncharacterized protein LOC129962942 [Argiope bruennichi]|uniref:uncharacterized protein LOC129962942 n=1 Tax=Argiope bruennichi TaxID=94029 RepID=UPI0024958928|nr:uncharacterized protein LOC129962942 [Argiope bruennichi]